MVKAAKKPTSTKRRSGVVSAFVFQTPDLALVARIRNLAEFARQCLDDFWDKRVDMGFFVGALRRCEFEMQSLKSEPKLGTLGEAQRYFLELSEELSSVLTLAAEASVRDEPISTQEYLKHQVRIQYLSNALLSESRIALNGMAVEP